MSTRPEQKRCRSIEVSHRGQAGHVHGVQPTGQALIRWAVGAQVPCPTHGQRRKDGALAFTGRYAGSRNSHVHSIALWPKPARVQR